MASGIDMIAPAGFAWAVTPSDTVDLVMEARALYVGGGGNVVVIAYDPATNKRAAVTLVGVSPGAILPIRCSRVNSTSTTATSIVALA